MLKTKINNSLRPLKYGDTIEIVAPASHAPIENLVKGAEVLRSWGYKVIYNKNLLKPEMFLSNSDEYRFKSFEKAMTNKKSHAVWCLRGGYGAIRLLPFIEKMKIPKNKKIIIGLSDICSIHTVINHKWNWPSLHASLIDRLALNKLSNSNISELKNVLEVNKSFTIFNNLVAVNKAATTKKIINSKVVGGNLMVVTSTLGTLWQINAKNKILFLEELGERAYRVDRCLQQLSQAGAFVGVKAIVFGEFTGCDEPNKTNLIPDVLREFFKKINIPVYTGIETGHGELQRPLFFNTKTKLTCARSAKMIVYSPY